MAETLATKPENTVPWDNSKIEINVSHDTIRENLERNIRRPIKQMRSYPRQSKEIAIVGGGWSLTNPEVYEELRQLWFRGAPFVALNGAAKWLMERNMKPAMQVMLDAREDNVQFVEEPIPNCKYFICSQCHPAVFDALEGRDVTMFHVMAGENSVEQEILDKYFLERWTKVPSASSVGMTAILVMRILGFVPQHLFGIDSCYPHDGSYHHAYPQPLNDDEGSGRFWCAGREFRCSAWQAAQAESFRKIVTNLGNGLRLSVHGDGLLRHILQTGADLSKTKE